MSPLGNTDVIGFSPSIVHKDSKSETETELSVLVVLEWLTWVPHGDCGVG